MGFLLGTFFSLIRCLVSEKSYRRIDENAHEAFRAETGARDEVLFLRSFGLVLVNRLGGFGGSYESHAEISSRWLVSRQLSPCSCMSNPAASRRRFSIKACRASAEISLLPRSNGTIEKLTRGSPLGVLVIKPRTAFSFHRNIAS